MLLGEAGACARRLKAAENPLDLMLARAWLTRELYEAGKTFARLHARARLSLPPMRTSSLERRGGSASAQSDPVALWRLNEIWSALSIEQRSALLDICVLEIWPNWLVAAAITAEETLRAALLAGPSRRVLELGLAQAAEIMRRPTPPGLTAGSDLSEFVSWMRAG
ncbi:MAG: hypothetical protein WCI21_01470 [Alphaproteobacteria bacterium]